MRSLRARITAAVTLVAVAVSACTGFLAIRQSYAALRLQQQRESLALATTIATQTDEVMSKTRFAIARLAADPALASLDPSIVQRLVDAVTGTAELLDGIVVADKRGRVLVMDTVPPATGPLVPANGVRLPPPPPAGKTVISRVYRAKSGQFCFAVVAALRRGSSLIGSVTGLTVLEEHSLGGLERVRIGESGRVYVLEKDGRVIAHPDPRRMFADARAWLPAQVFKDPSGVVIYRGPEGEPRLAGFALMPDTGWIVVVSRSVAEAYAGGRRLRLALILIFLAALPAAMIVGLLLGRGIARPIADLTRGARELTAGRLETRISRSSDDEIGELADTFNEMASGLSRTISQLNSFGYSVAHDLRAPARAVAAFSELVLSKAQGLDEASRLNVLRVQQAGQRMRRMLDGLLDLSRLSQAKLSMEAVDLSAIARTIAAELRSHEPRRKVVFEIAEGLVERADPGLAQVLLQNLLENAWKFTAGREEARIEFGRCPGSAPAAYFVRDNGLGFDMELAGRLFMPFHRLPNAAETPGLGLGLATCARIVEAHGGRIWTQARPGEGSAFFFVLA